MIAQEFAGYLKGTFESVLLEEKPDPHRTFFLRPSSLPFCGLRRFLTWAETGFDGIKESPVAAVYFTRVGTTTHTVFQQALGQKGKIIGNWKCRKCSFRRELTTYKRCKKCGDMMLHEEIEIRAGAWAGHLDGIYVAEDGTLWVIDYKTCKLSFITDKNSRPAQQYVHQQNHYVTLLEHLLKKKISGWMLVFLAREDPIKYNRVFPRKLRIKTKEKLDKKNRLFSRLHKSIFKIEKTNETKKLIEHKHCTSIEDHDRTFRWNPCPYRNTCFKKLALKKTVDKVVRESSHLPLIQYMPQKIRRDLYAKVTNT